ncbi:MAG TPA: RNA 2',3'-cyclic phosphodiesterase [Burkholderiaceae bacterium]|nr:RNA 2',3'-cyclic phosphodiesterase [Burkholderiaceae bacterium]
MKLFIALWPDEPARAALAADLPALARAAGGRPTAPANLHLTVAFIGPVDDRRFDDIAGLLAATRPPPFTVGLDRLDAFVSQRVLFRAPSQCPAVLLDAHRELVVGLAEAAVPVDQRPFRPHVTLARRCDRAALAAPSLREIVAGVRPFTWHAPGWALVESRSSPGGVVYHPHVIL